MRHRRCARQRQTGDHRQNGGKRHCRNKAEEQVTAYRVGQMHRRHVIAANQRARRIFIGGIRPHQHDSAEADNKGQNVEIAHKTGGVEHALARFAGIADRKETHQNMRQAGGAEHQSQTQRQRRNRILHQPSWAHNRCAFRVYRHRFGKQIIEAKADVFHHHKGHKTGAKQQQDGFDNLHPRCRQHPAEQHVHHHQHADQHYGDVIVEAEQQFNQFTGADHLGDEIKRHHYQGATGRKNTDWPLFQAIRGNVSKSITSQITQALGNQKQDDWPADKKAQRIDQPVITGGKHQRGNAEK